MTSIRLRFGVTLLATACRMGLSFLSGLLIARTLGASFYGDLSFLLGSFAALSLLLDPGTSQAFYTFLSQRPQGRGFFLLYFGWLLGSWGGAWFLLASLPESWLTRLWLGHPRQVILLACASTVLMTQAWGSVIQLAEARRQTVPMQLTMTVLAGVHLTLIAAATWLRVLSVQTVLWCLISEYLLCILLIAPGLIQANLTDEISDLCTLWSRFVTYCAPLALYGWAGFLYSFADKWWLQRYGGSHEQGFFAISQQCSLVSILATTSVLHIIGKEVADAFQAGDSARITHLYRHAAQGCWFLSACVSCFLIPLSRPLVTVLLGPSYAGAWLSVAVMLFYPLLQSLGQINSTIFHATEQTRTYAWIGGLSMLLGLPLAYLLLVTLRLGALGLTLKTVLLGVLGVGLQTLALTTRLTLPPGWFLPSLLSVLLLLGLSYTAYWLTRGLTELVGRGRN